MSPVTSGPSVGSPPTLRVSLYTARLAAQGSGLRGRLGHIFLLSGSGQDRDDPVEAASRPCRTGVLSPSLEMKQCLTHAHTHTHTDCFEVLSQWIISILFLYSVTPLY